MPQVPELSPLEFRDRWLQNGPGAAVLLDVREPAELALAHVAAIRG
jgi:rhodanese-related sulfurtransferase